MLHGELRELRRSEFDCALRRAAASRPCDSDLLESAQRSAYRARRSVRQRDRDFHVGAARCPAAEAGNHLRVADLDRPGALSVTGCQMPVSRSRTAGIQSQPSVATNVGPSRHIMPPFSPGPPRIDCSCGMPGWGGGEMRTASTFVSPGFRTSVTSKTPRMNAPLIVPSDLPLSHTAAA